MHDPEVTVLTPVYNGETYIEECITSVLAQTYKNWKYIIVNNCSTDRTLEISENFARLDPRIQVVNNQEFVGAIENHNIAFRLVPSTSSYTKVVQGDDWLFPHCIEEMVRIGEEYPQVGIIGAYRLDQDKVNLDGLPYPSPCVSGQNICRLHLLDEYHVLGSPTSTMIRSEHVKSRDPFYDESQMHCDKDASIRTLQSSDFGFVHQVLTFTRRRPGEDRTTTARRYNTYLTAEILLLKKFGSNCLSTKELANRNKTLMKRYCRFLGAQLIGFRGKDFWHFHRTEQKKIGLKVPWAIVGFNAMLAVGIRTLKSLSRKF